MAAIKHMKMQVSFKKAHGKKFNITSCSGNVGKNHNDIPPDIYKHG